ncbi:MAG: multicomponent Na+:H+ antiporter subunit [Candidatus Atribacteria bacterium]|nr:multicomponent Na+:H+ antiporter subunit [Candidatus Atribacteria bacterium]
MKIFLLLVLFSGIGFLLIDNLRFLSNSGFSLGAATHYYVTQGFEQTGALNLVSSILYDFRAFDSLGESTVIFAAVSGIVSLLSRKTLPVSSHGLSIIVKRIFGILTPFLFVSGIYLILHGHLSPGGGFQGGVILGTISIVFCIVYGSSFDYTRYSPQSKTILEVSGALLFLAMGIIGIFLEGFFLANWFSSPERLGKLLTPGSIFGINLGVGIKIGAGLSIIFYSIIQKRIEGK